MQRSSHGGRSVSNTKYMYHTMIDYRYILTNATWCLSNHKVQVSTEITATCRKTGPCKDWPFLPVDIWKPVGGIWSASQMPVLRRRVYVHNSPWRSLYHPSSTSHDPWWPMHQDSAGKIDYGSCSVQYRQPHITNTYHRYPAVQPTAATNNSSRSKWSWLKNKI